MSKSVFLVMGVLAMLLAVSIPTPTTSADPIKLKGPWGARFYAGFVGNLDLVEPGIHPGQSHTWNLTVGSLVMHNNEKWIRHYAFRLLKGFRFPIILTVGEHTRWLNASFSQTMLTGRISYTGFSYLPVNLTVTASPDAPLHSVCHINVTVSVPDYIGPFGMVAWISGTTLSYEGLFTTTNFP